GSLYDSGQRKARSTASSASVLARLWQCKSTRLTEFPHGGSASSVMGQLLSTGQRSSATDPAHFVVASALARGSFPKAAANTRGFCRMILIDRGSEDRMGAKLNL